MINISIHYGGEEVTCKNCGEEVLSTERYCSYCGEPNPEFGGNNENQVVERRIVYEYHNRRSTGNGLIALGIIGIIFGILFPLVTYCTSITGWVLAANRPDKKGMVLNIIAVIIAAINSIWGLILQFG